MSSPKKPTIGQAPIDQKASPAVNEHKTSPSMTIMKPRGLSDR